MWRGKIHQRDEKSSQRRDEKSSQRRDEKVANKVFVALLC
jgi:hypothetical protein